MRRQRGSPVGDGPATAAAISSVGMPTDETAFRFDRLSAGGWILLLVVGVEDRADREADFPLASASESTRSVSRSRANLRGKYFARMRATVLADSSIADG